MSSSALTANVKSALLMGWRERWSDEHWGVAIKRHFPQGASGDVSQLAGQWYFRLYWHVAYMYLPVA